MRLPKGPLQLEQSQAAAAVGQITLAHSYQELFKARGLTTAQVLLTLGDTEERRRYLNARRTVGTLLAHGAIPVVNENDTVATSEIRYGDNDRLSARVASMISADCLVLLSDVDGLYTHPPASHPEARRLDVVRRTGFPAVARRHEDQNRGRPHCARRRHAYGHRLRQGSAPAAGARRRRAVHLVPGAVGSGHRQEALDRRVSSSRGACCRSMPARSAR